jgi:hypothetical protein
MVFLLDGLAGLGIASLLVVALAEWGKFRVKAEKGFNWIGLAGIWFLFAGGLQIAFTLNVGALPTIATYLGTGATGIAFAIFQIVGWIFALIGTIFAAYEILVEK